MSEIKNDVMLMVANACHQVHRALCWAINEHPYCNRNEQQQPTQQDMARLSRIVFTREEGHVGLLVEAWSLRELEPEVPDSRPNITPCKCTRREAATS